MRKILVVEPNPEGHRPFYLSLIVLAFTGWKITLLTPPEEPSVLEHFKRRGIDPASCRFVSPKGSSPAEIISQSAGIVSEGGYMVAFFAYFDSYIPDLLVRPDGFPCPVSGIWFHPYDLDRRYRWLPPLDKRLKRRGLVHRSLRRLNPGLKFRRVFFLDGNTVKKLASVNPGIPSAVLPDPWEKKPMLAMAEARDRFGLPQDRKIFLHIGSSEKRKGLTDVIAAFGKVSSANDVTPPLLLRVGENKRLDDHDRKRLSSLQAKDLARLVEGFVPEEDFVEYFSAADWILIPYRSFRYSSGILSNAIGAGKPVIAANFGLIGSVVGRNSHGLLYKHKSSAGLTRRILEALANTGKRDPSVSTMELSPDLFVANLRVELLG